ncbi:heavy metal translocating P-type ATPase [Methylobacterium sp. J-026]|uniref:heavy metal translocating P-type ATPase n=1 Tax=Methylobacterium sp. J-026 TaxID=2836624 RepID=UPI001FBB80A0|nr:heavy metal translocating P-type ATPase [Methylobacterium sp. J-026]MCJ2136814.1 heavy metal translocating P-type ATPase [Methylobacterium sp. J-026]
MDASLTSAARPNPVALNIPVEGMSCASCVGRVERALAALPGSRDVAVNLATGRASLVLGGSAGPLEAATALAEAGYPVPEAQSLLAVEGLSCASCVGRVERALAAVPGVTGASVNLAAGRAAIRHPEGLVAIPDLVAAVSAAGYEAHPLDLATPVDPAARRAEEGRALRRDLIVAALLAAPVVVLDMGGHVLPGLHGGRVTALVQAVLATLVLAGPGRRFFLRGVPGLLRGHPDMNALVALGAGAAYLYSLVSVAAPGLLPAGAAHLYFEASVLIVTLILLGRTLEAGAKGRTGAAIARLMDLAPKTARVVRDGAEADVPLAALRLGDVVRVRPGERVAADGVVVAGTGHVDESMVTGEPAPVRKAAGDRMVGGTLNGRGSLDLRVEALGGATVLAQITAMVERAQGGKLPIQALVDRVTGRFVPAVIGIAAATFLGWLLLGPAPALGTALVNAVAVLIIACPCAMGLATPTAIMVGTGRAAARGVLFRDGAALQRLRDVRVVALDKTGTLTEGRPRLTDFHVRPGIAEDAALALAAGLETRSEHPLAEAVVAAARGRGLVLPEPERFEAVEGFGVSGRVAGRDVALGAPRYLDRLGIARDPDLDARAGLLAEAGRSPIHLALDGRHAAVLAVADPVKTGARAAVAALKAQGLTVAMVTGDDPGAAAGVARSLGIDLVAAGVLPGGKVEAVRQFRAAHGPVAFVGDGINDAPALAEADVGLAIGTGTDIAVDSADVVLMSGALDALVEALALSRAVMANIRQNLFWAFAYNAALIPIAAGLLVPFGGPALSPVLAAGAMAFSSVFVLGNALRLRRAGGAMPTAVPKAA